MKSSTNRFYTIMIVPEKTTQVRKILVPAWVVRLGAVAIAVMIVLVGVMVANYGYVMSQVGENNELKTENRRLRQSVQVFKSKMGTLESAMERVKTFSTRLKVITGAEDRGGVASLMKSIPDSATNIGGPKDVSPEVAAIEAELDPRDPEHEELQKQYSELELKISSMTAESLALEQNLQDQYEHLVDQKTFLAALPTRKPVIGYYTNGFGTRYAPFGGKLKMHEGLDIANHPGTPIKATADGVVTFSNTKAGYGQTVIVDHGYGLQTWYAHTRKILVKSGQKVRRGDTIALLGSSGRSTGPHCHYEVRVNGIPVDPLSYILEN
ncbi:MAG: peptidoglycan DD-metalloendopeptidase family protein [Cryobacterium sp.]|nr:peptidoglycan DD-metalloendopeptidase family protein [Oligoflexia bacterium]